MKLAILSDTHDQLANLATAIDYCNKNDIRVLVHCGDLISPFMLKQLTRFQGQVHLIYGNNTGDQHLISSQCGTTFPNIRHHGVFGEFLIADQKIALVHYPNQALGLAHQKIYDIVCCGHSHTHSIQWIDKTLLVNPGHLFGENDQAGFYIIDLETMNLQRIGIGVCMLDQEIPVRAGSVRPL